MSAPRFTVINTFTLEDPAGAGAFEESFLEHVAWMRAREGFGAHLAMRATSRPGVYVNVGWWRSPEDFQQVLGSETFREHAQRFHEIVDVEVDPAMEVAGVAGDAPSTATTAVVDRFTVTGDTDAFEAAYRVFAKAAGLLPGFLGADLAKALRRPGGYTAVTRWAEGADPRGVEQLAEHAELVALAQVDTLVTAPFASHVAAAG